MTESRQNILTAVVFLALGVGAFAIAINIPRRMPIGIDSGFLPEIVAGAIIVASLALLGRTLTKRNVARVKDPEPAEAATAQNRRLPVLALNLLLLMLYLVVLPVLGFLLATLPYLFLQAVLIGNRTLRALVGYAIFALVGTLLTWGIFDKGFGLVLPSGLMG